MLTLVRRVLHTPMLTSAGRENKAKCAIHWRPLAPFAGARVQHFTGPFAGVPERPGNVFSHFQAKKGFLCYQLFPP